MEAQAFSRFAKEIGLGIRALGEQFSRKLMRAHYGSQIDYY